MGRWEDGKGMRSKFCAEDCAAAHGDGFRETAGGTMPAGLCLVGWQNGIRKIIKQRNFFGKARGQNFWEILKTSFQYFSVLRFWMVQFGAQAAFGNPDRAVEYLMFWPQRDRRGPGHMQRMQRMQRLMWAEEWHSCWARLGPWPIASIGILPGAIGPAIRTHLRPRKAQRQRAQNQLLEVWETERIWEKKSKRK